MTKIQMMKLTKILKNIKLGHEAMNEESESSESENSEEKSD